MLISLKKEILSSEKEILPLPDCPYLYTDHAPSSTLPCAWRSCGGALRTSLLKQEFCRHHRNYSGRSVLFELPALFLQLSRGGK